MQMKVGPQFYDRIKLALTFLGLGRGDRLKLMAFIAENKARLLRDYGRLTVAEKQAYNVDVLSQTPRSNPNFNPTIPTIPLAPTTRVTHVEDDDEEVFYDCD
jgi:hypothetical protein